MGPVEIVEAETEQELNSLLELDDDELGFTDIQVKNSDTEYDDA
jgi:hypothetical protein